jgi:predicted outer membrane repeat protein
VDAAAGGANDGTSWADAFNRLEEALVAAAEGDRIWVAQGTYVADAGSGERQRAFGMRSGVEVLGGFNGTELTVEERDAVMHETILSGDIGLRGSAGDNSLHVVDASGVAETCVLDGFIIEDGRADGDGPNGGTGAGVLCLKGNPTIIRCVFRRNSAVRGGAIYMQDSIPTLVACMFTENSASDGGGAIRAITSAPAIIDTTFHGNSAGTTGGALLNTAASDTRMVQCVFSGNSAAGGGAIANALGSHLSINHCTIAYNTATGGGGGVHVTQASSHVRAANTILFGNTDASGSTEAAQIGRTAGSVAIDYSCVQGLTGSLGGEGNIDAAPGYVDPIGPDGIMGTQDDDLHPAPGSSVTDAGSNALSEAGKLDLDGGARFADDPRVADTGVGPAPVVDMGAYEFTRPACACDFNLSGELNSQDFFDFLSGFFDAAPGADINTDGVVNSQDFFDFLTCFFAGCA